MQYVEFGKTGLRVSQMALGTGTLAAEHATPVLGAYLEAGGSLIDTSDAYQGGASEELIGAFLGQNRDDVILASKYSRSTLKTPSPARTGNHRKAMVQSLEGSLRRLKTDRIDLYFAHFDDGVTPMEEIMRGFHDLVCAGKVLYAGLSNFPAWRTAQASTIADLRCWTPLASIEVEYSLLQRTTEREILPFARASRLGVLGYSPLAAGMLTGKKDSKNPSSASRVGLPTEADLPKVLDTLAAIAAEVGTEPANAALAWIIAKGIIPILGVRDLNHLTENLRAAGVLLTAEQIQRLDDASQIPLGYPQALMAMQKTQA